MQTATKNRIIALASRPAGAPTSSNFRTEEADLRELREGEVQLQTLFLSLDPYMRGRMDEAPSYAPPVALGAAMAGEAVSIVVASRNERFPVGTMAFGHTGWQSHPISDCTHLKRLPEGLARPSHALSILGMPGFTAWYGLFEIGRPAAGETVVVSAATGAVGSVVGQLARLHGCNVVGIASGDQKCRFAVEELGLHACLDRNKESFAEDLAAACPDGVDVYFENVGGTILKTVWPLLNVGARIPVCGLVSQYSGFPEGQGADTLALAMKDILLRRYTLQGFIILDHYATHFQQFFKTMSKLLEDGKVVFREDVRDGLENAPEAFLDMLAGRNFGKVVIRVSES
jgi:NADPH-dependent curcumin reductase